ncbi:Holliday junction resolvase RuvX [Helicobacter winghamensis]|uniref:Putative pre-16S rRNA nuclease n=1 Tax=Helicobacter winghamensis TaxID=157268 RepID=A0A2N3PHF6_9HELI|nr:Holliday junction resolvase RuvX [Helicobacter winghamensis]EEO26510.1 RNAse H domain protein, YqgF family [Helicobacter winghamensis ATCC BAA-430]PKT75440.1 crossover junction endodeoxyribonuclease RuvA [Helicobacter winghamensis]PKT75608.1 crossover junction endodeoxyribonuclease RuvA [Helicobacter winghamensis]PKT75816.1 crossover junction endodeoxyribonuclease RuvA [Helicobacter winghamensis]PKT79905.1 crossover junction endodeoxyribonuclease RuvA [Helicobacter winghamensis]
MESKIIIAIDIGLKRIGVAKSIRGIPLCLEPILRKNRNQAANAVRTLVLELQANVLVVGIPFVDDVSKANDSICAMQRRIKHFVGLLELESKIEIVFFDESFSSKEALEKLDDKKMRKKAHSKDGSLDSLAALVILERYLMCQKQY